MKEIEKEVEAAYRTEQMVAILIDGNNIEQSLHNKYKEVTCMLNFDLAIPKVLKGRALKKLVYFREGVNISDKLTRRLKNKFFGTTVACHKSADVPLTIHAIQLVDKVDTIIIFSGDSDYISLAEFLKQRGVRVEIVGVHGTVSKVLVEKSDDIYYLSEEEIWFNKDEVLPPTEAAPIIETEIK